MNVSLKDKLRTRLIWRLLRWSADCENAGGSYYTTFHQRPKQSDQIGTWPEPDCAVEGCAIVMQGPIAKDDDFTLETLRLYRRNMPNAILILSTWKDEDQAQLAQVAAFGVIVVQSDKPSVPGLFNLNMQLVSAGAGVRKAVDAGARWILKTRTDQRLYEPNALPFLIGMAETFPIVIPSEQRYRIIGVGHGSLKFAPYHVTDQTVFGNALDMLAYWTPQLQDADVAKRWTGDREYIYCNNSIGSLCRETVAESYLASRFLIRMDRKLDWTIQDSWAAYRDHFCFVDYITTDFYWEKCQTYTCAEFNKTYKNVSNRQEMGFLEWMLIYSGKLHPNSGARYNKVLDDSFLGIV